MVEMVFTRSYCLLIFFQVLLTTQGCMDGLTSCFGYFNPRVTSSGPGICDLVADQLDCLTMVRQSCDPGSALNIDGALSGMQGVYSTCTFDNIGLTPGYESTQCTKLFGECQSSITDTSCSRITSYEACSEGISTFCSSDHLTTVTDIINTEKQRLSAEQGCVFATVTTQKVLLSGTACYLGFQSCYTRQGVDTDDHPCVLAPVYESCFQSDVSGVCDDSSTSIVSSVVSSKQSECDAVSPIGVATTTVPLETTTVPQETTVPLETTTLALETTTLLRETTTLLQETTTLGQETTTLLQDTTTFALEITNLALETSLAQESTTHIPETSTLAQETQTAVPDTTTVVDLKTSTDISETSPIAQERTIALSEDTTSIVQETTTDVLEISTDISETTVAAQETVTLPPETTIIGHGTTTRALETSEVHETTLVQDTTTFAQDMTFPEVTTRAQDTTLAQDTTVAKVSTLVQDTTTLTPKATTTLDSKLTTASSVQQSTTGSMTSIIKATTKGKVASAPTKASAALTKTSQTPTTTDASSTKETVVVSEKGPGQIHLYYGNGSNLRCTEFMLLFEVFLSLVSMLDVIS